MGMPLTVLRSFRTRILALVLGLVTLAFKGLIAASISVALARASSALTGVIVPLCPEWTRAQAHQDEFRHKQQNY